MIESFSELLVKSKQNYEIAKLAQESEYYDISVSRYYYSLYQLILCFIALYPEIQLPSCYDKKGPHVKRFMHFIHIIKTDTALAVKLESSDILLTSQLRKLKEKREKADYDNKTILYKEFAGEFLKNFERLHLLLHKLLKFKEAAL